MKTLIAIIAAIGGIGLLYWAGVFQKLGSGIVASRVPSDCIEMIASSAYVEVGCEVPGIPIILSDFTVGDGQQGCGENYLVRKGKQSFKPLYKPEECGWDDK